MSLADIPVQIDRADLAFGPLYLCAGANAGDLCDTARVEWLGTSIIDTTNAEPTQVGELVGVTGMVRSWMYDLGISSQLTRKDPYVLDAARELGSVSLVLEGRADVDGLVIPFTASVPIQQTVDTELGVPVVRKSTSDEFLHDILPNESGLLVRFDPAVWVRGIDFGVYVASEPCTENGPSTLCDREYELSCDSDIELSRRDCSALGQVCLPDQGCSERLRIEDNNSAYRSIRNALTSGQRPTFNWGYAP